MILRSSYYHAAAGFFCVCTCVTATGQTATSVAAAGPTSGAPTAATTRSKMAATQNADAFPARSEAVRSWNGGRDPVATDATGEMPDPVGVPSSRTSASGNRVTASPLPSPKIDAVKEATERLSPLTPAEVARFRQNMYERSLEQSQIPGGPYVSSNRRITVDLSPGMQPPKLSIAFGSGANVALVDRAGNPLVIDSVQGFSPAFKTYIAPTQRAEETGTNLFTIEAKALSGYGNISIQLHDFPTAFTVNIEVGKSTNVDATVTLVLPYMAASRQLLAGDRMEADAALPSEAMEGFLAAIPPEGAQDVVVKGARDIQAWLWNQKLYVRSRASVVSPGWFKRLGAADGTIVYELPLTPLVSLQSEGRTVDAEMSFPIIPASIARKADAAPATTKATR